MKTISDYTIYCTEEQTRKALGLGAPIEFIKVGKGKPCHYITSKEKRGYYVIPTAEQMVRWLEEQGCITYVYPVIKDGQEVLSARIKVMYKSGSLNLLCGYDKGYSVILTAIDAALEYLENKK